MPLPSTIISITQPLYIFCDTTNGWIIHGSWYARENVIIWIFFGPNLECWVNVRLMSDTFLVRYLTEVPQLYDTAAKTPTKTIYLNILWRRFTYGIHLFSFIHSFFLHYIAPPLVIITLSGAGTSNCRLPVRQTYWWAFL